MSVRFLATCFIHSPLGSDVIPPMHLPGQHTRDDPSGEICAKVAR